MRRFLVTVGVCVMVSAALARAEDKKFTYLDLQPRANHKLTDIMHGDFVGNTLESLKTGEQSLEGVKFKIGEKFIQLGSTHPTLQDKPEKVEEIKVNKKFEKLHILHATGYKTEDDAVVGEYTVTWDDDTQGTIPITYGKDVLDWWYQDNSPVPANSKIAWKGENEAAKARNSKIRLYLTTWENPKPDKKVVKLDFSSTMQTEAAPFCVAMTIEEK